MKKFALGLSACALGVVLLGCSAVNATMGHSLDTKMNNLQNTISSITTISNAELALDPQAQTPDVVETALYNGFGNVNTYMPFGYGMNPYYNMYGNMYGQFNNAAGFGNMGFGMGAYANPYYGFGNMGYGMPNRWASNIDTYRISAVQQDGRTTTTIDTYHDGEHTNHQVLEEDTDENQHSQPDAQTNSEVALQMSSVNCILANNYGNLLKEEILSNIEEVKDLSNNIKNATIKLSSNQVQGVNELLDNITRTQTKLNMAKGELIRQYKSVQNNKGSLAANPLSANSKYVSLLSSMDTRNAYLQSILNSLLQVQNCLDGTCQTGYNSWNGSATNPNWLQNCPNGECAECSNCPSCATCNKCADCSSCSGCIECQTCDGCLLCTNCQDCTNCFNCTNCTGCSNLANVNGYHNNQPCQNCDNNDCSNCQNNQSTTTLPNLPSNGSISANQATNQHIDQTEQTATEQISHENFDADDVVADNLLDNTETAELLQDTAQTNQEEHMPDDQSENPVLNENEFENNKALTA